MNRKERNSPFNANYFSLGPYKRARISGWEKYFGKYFWARRFYASLIRRLTPKGGRILELGCGFGDLLKFLERDYETVGTDISKEAIAKAGKNLNNSRVLVLRAEELQILKPKFDTIVACHILEHLKNPEEVIEKAASSLKKKGLFFIVVPDPSSIARRLKGDKWIGFSDKTHISLFSPDKWISILKRNNFEIKKVYSDGLWDSPYLKYLPKFLEQLLFGLPAIMQTLSGRLFIPLNWGESAIIIAKRK